MSDAAQEQYEAEQKQLRDNTSDIRIDPPKEPEVDPRVYRDVEQLLFRGFLIAHAEINGVSFVLKSLNHHEFENIQLMVGHRSDVRIHRRFYNLFLAYGVLMVDGQSVLENRNHWISEIAATFDILTPVAHKKVVRTLSEINRRASNAVVLTEAYTMETTSRFRWAQLRGLDLTSPAVTGLGGTSALGLNWCQLVWRALNSYEDLKENAEREWEYAKFVGSCFAGKGISKIYNQDSDRRRKEQEERRFRKDVLIKHVLLGEPIDKSGRLEGAQVLVTAKTVEELASQLEKSLRGEKDWHDEVVAAKEEAARKHYEAKQDQLRKAAEERERIFGASLVLGGTDMAGLTQDQVRERVERKRQIDAQRLAAGIVNEAELEKQDHVHDKWISRRR